jgi:predicted Zn-dependent peptidase
VNRPWVCLAACRRGGRLVVAAALVDATAGAAPSAAAEDLLARPLDYNPRLDMGHLPNGLRYVILPNATPPGRFEAHLEMHAGSVDEGEAEQGVAHLVEHVTFLGSKKREGLLGTGARSNAYTDFHHTVFHVHSPAQNGNSGGAMLPVVLDALAEIAFEPEFLPSRIEKERKAVTAEAQMMNTIEYRVDCQLLQYLHWENALGSRFPIGKMDQVAGWAREDIMDFWGRHYFPANATLYVVGDVDVAATKDLVASTFGRVPASLRQPAPAAAELDAAVVADATRAGAGAEAADAAPPAPPARRDGLMARPPVVHQWGCGPAPPAPVSIFRHRLLQLFQLSVFCKLPIRPMTTMDDLR